MARTLTVHLSDAQSDRLDRYAKAHGAPPDETAGRLVDEALRAADHPDIEFRDSAAGRRACIRGSSLAVWLDAVTRLQNWQGGRLLRSDDRVILSEAMREGLTFVTRDISTIVPLLRSLAAEGEAHAGVIFVDHLAVPEGNIGTLVRAVAALWRSESESLSDWTNVVIYLRPAPK